MVHSGNFCDAFLDTESKEKMTGDNVLCKNWYLLREKQFQTTPT